MYLIKSMNTKIGKKEKAEIHRKIKAQLPVDLFFFFL